jgi:glycerol uptake facilitator protein
MEALFGELIGTFLLIVFGGGVVAGSVLKKSKAEAGGWIVIVVGWGLGVTLAVYTSGQISGAHINPAVTISLWLKGDYPFSKVPYYILGQFLGAMLGALAVWLHYLPHWKKTDDKDAILAVFSTAPAIKSNASNLLSEILGTFILMLSLSAIGTNNFADGLNPLVIGVLIVAIGASLGGTTGYAINPARDLGPRIMHYLLPIPNKGKSDWAYSWIPVVGPIIGGIFGVFVYQYFFNGIFHILLPVSSLIILIIAILSIKENLKK